MQTKESFKCQCSTHSEDYRLVLGGCCLLSGFTYYNHLNKIQFKILTQLPVFLNCPLCSCFLKIKFIVVLNILLLIKAIKKSS